MINKICPNASLKGLMKLYKKTRAETAEYSRDYSNLKLVSTTKESFGNCEESTRRLIHLVHKSSAFYWHGTCTIKDYVTRKASADVSLRNPGNKKRVQFRMSCQI